MTAAVKCLILLSVVALLFATELVPLAITATAGAIACGVLGFIPVKSVFTRFIKFYSSFICRNVQTVGAAMFHTGPCSKNWYRRSKNGRHQ